MVWRRCCDDCCLDSPFRRKEREERPNPCLGVFPPQNAAVPPGTNPNRRGRTMDRNRQTLDGRPVDDGRAQYEAEEEFDRYVSASCFLKVLLECIFENDN